MSKRRRSLRALRTQAGAGQPPRGRGAFVVPPMDRRLAKGILGLALGAAAIAAYLTYVHYALRADPSWAVACATAPSLGCDPIVRSAYGTIAGVPLPLVGTWLYVVMAGFAALDVGGMPQRFPRSPSLVVLVASSGTLAVSIGLAALSGLSLRAFCPWCVLLCAVNVGLLLISARAVRSTGESVRTAWVAEGRYWRRRWPSAFTLASSAILSLVVIGVVYRVRAEPSALCQASVDAVTGATAADVVELTIYEDFQCPACKALERTLRRLTVGPNVDLRRRDYPLDAECNPYVHTSVHAGACLLARAAICADEQHKREPYGAAVFESTARTQEPLIAIARSLEMDLPAFEDCLASDRTARALRDSVDAAARAGVKSTPATVVLGRVQLGGWSQGDMHCVEAMASGNRSGLER
jgi:uncharacterized membrane protein